MLEVLEAGCAGSMDLYISLDVILSGGSRALVTGLLLIRIIFYHHHHHHHSLSTPQVHPTDFLQPHLTLLLSQPRSALIHSFTNYSSYAQPHPLSSAQRIAPHRRQRPPARPPHRQSRLRDHPGHRQCTSLSPPPHTSLPTDIQSGTPPPTLPTTSQTSATARHLSTTCASPRLCLRVASSLKSTMARMVGSVLRLFLVCWFGKRGLWPLVLILDRLDPDSDAVHHRLYCRTEYHRLQSDFASIYCSRRSCC